MTTKGTFGAPVVVDAAGAWAGQVARSVGLDVPVSTWREHTAYFGIPEALPGELPAVIDDVNVCSFRPEGSAMLLASIEDANTLGGSPDREMPTMPGEVLDRMIERLARRSRSWSTEHTIRPTGARTGITPDQRPILGQAGPEGFFLSCGFSGTGFKIAPAVGRALAELVVDGRSSSVDISMYRLGRFAEGKHLRGDHPYPALWR